MEKFFVSMLRFSTAMTLFGMEQIQASMNLMTGGEDLTKSMERFRKAMDAVSDAVVKDEKQRETLDSVTSVSEDAVHRTMDGLSFMDPREYVRATADLMKRTSDSMSDFMSRTESEEDEESGPKKAADLSKEKSKGKTH